MWAFEKMQILARLSKRKEKCHFEYLKRKNSTCKEYICHWCQTNNNELMSEGKSIYVPWTLFQFSSNIGRMARWSDNIMYCNPHSDHDFSMDFHLIEIQIHFSVPLLFWCWQQTFSMTTNSKTKESLVWSFTIRRKQFLTRNKQPWVFY